MRRLFALFCLLMLPLLAACSAVQHGGPPPQPTPAEIARLATEINALEPGIDPSEAARIARIAYTYPLQLREQYQVSDPPLIHNIKVNNGSRPRGLCFHWADDLEARLRQEGFRTLKLHRAIANADRLAIEHSTVIVSGPNGQMEDGIVLDPWRYGGRLYWGPVTQDRAYPWVPRQEVFAMKRARRARVSTAQ